MRPEKKYLLEEVGGHLSKSDFVFLADYNTVNVEEVGELREKLADESAEFHVVKNSILNLVARERKLPDLKEWLAGQTAIVVGGDNPSGVAKVLRKFSEDKKKLGLKVGVLGDRVLSKDEIIELSKLPSLEALKAQLLGLFQTPARNLLMVCNGVPTGLLNVLKAKEEQG